MKLKDMTDRELILFVIGEVRGVKNLVSNHLAHHEKQDDRRWKLYVGLLLTVITVSGGIAAALMI